MNVKVIDRNITVENDTLIITETTQTEYKKDELEYKIRELQMKKIKNQEQTSRLVDEYNKNNTEEKEISEWLTRFEVSE